MPERARKPRPVRRRDVYTEADGLFGRLTDMVIENPVRSGAFVMMLTVIGTIISNAAYFQTAHHPAPLFATRPDGGDTPAPLPKARTEPVPYAKDASVHADAAPDPANLVMDTQKALTALQLYQGPIDGKLGPQTRAALSAFETKLGLQPTGQPSARLLVQLRKASAKPGSPEASAAPNEQPSSDPTATGSIDPAVSAKRIRKVQAALNTIGYGPIKADGKGGGDTANAIRRFELDNGLAVTGEANDALIAKLVLIGAMAPP